VYRSGGVLFRGDGTPLASETAVDEKRNSTIQGGTRQKLYAGDIIRIPARTAHQVLLEGAHEFTY